MSNINQLKTKLSNVTILGFAGKAGSGKDTIAEVIEQYGLTRNRIIWKFAFAEALKHICVALFDHITVEDLYKRKIKEQIIDEDYFKDFTWRRFLQKLGTEAFRNIICDDFWIRIICVKIKNSLTTKLTIRQPHYILFTDVRFNNEIQFIRELGGKIYFLRRDIGAGLSGQESTHASEKDIAGLCDDIIENNTNDKNDLLAKAIKIIEDHS